jgi:hypothetical protein
LETHRSQSGIHSIKEFLLEVLMIVVGVLIALGVEQLRSAWHERYLANEARESFRQEIELERLLIKEYVPKVADSRSVLQKMIDDPATRSQAGLKLPPSLQWQFLPTEAWDTAVATQAFSYMDPAEVQHYANLHMLQTLFDSFEQKHHELLVDVFSYDDRKDLTPDEIKARNHDIRILLGNLQSIDQLSQQLLHEFDAVSPVAPKLVAQK